ncbi:hypothetical protein F2P81_005308 [Scophthalmus maximus]|uniref:Calponin-homology (CH) domain-containing protein n=1 Tax=Scophthalmus maximus TaxID=52904 RepID=A0A6A4T2S6_SCOMX|nr:hypothetical protein F2P81_005308 [Scophthalmus maximus]
MAETVTSARKHGFLDISPGRSDAAAAAADDKENNVPVLSLIQFSKAPFVAFGTVKLGTSRSAVLRIENPADDAEAEVTVEKIPSGKGFSVDRSAFTIQPEGVFSLTVTWTPSEEGGIRELIVFNANGVLKHQAVMLGRAEAPKKKKKSLWDTIKNKREGGKAAAPRSKKTGPPLKMAANKTFQVPDALGSKPENKDLLKILNRTLSPIGTPERFRKLVPVIHLESPLSVTAEAAADADDANSDLTRTPVLSLKDALALIDSDLSNINASPRDSSSAFSDSLESKSGSRGGGPDGIVLGALPDSPELPESNEPRLTFFVSSKAVAAAAEDVATETVKRASFTSATVVKSRAPAEEHGSSGRKMKKSRRRLLEKTLELSDSSSQCDSGTSSPKLPVIDPDTVTNGRQNADVTGRLCDATRQVLEFTSSSPTPVTFPITSPPSMAPTRFSFSVTSPPPAATASISFTATSPAAPASPPPLRRDLSLHEPCPTDSAPPSAPEDSFPIHVAAAASKKRKSEEYLRSDAKAAAKSDRVKRTKVAATKTESLRSVRERSASQRQQQRTAAAPSLKSYGASAVKTAKLVAVAQSKLTFVKPTQSAIPRHPMPFAAKNMFYDERWIEKQERGFTWWINYVLTPDDFKVNTEVAKVSAVSLAMGNEDNLSVPKAPTKEEMSFSTYTARRKLNRLRRSACQLFTSAAMVKAIQRLELEVEAKRLLVRKDRHLWKDIGERRKVLNWLLSYNPLWMRIGLETIFGELISLESNSDGLGLAMFILQRLLWNPDIAAQFRHAKVPHLYKDGHEEALSRFTLKKLLLLVCFLDKAKESRLIEHDPCLFCVDAEFKTSKDLLLAFSRDFLSGEGILPRHLGYLGLPVTHVQKPLDEFNFAVKNLAADLKCGVRLVRVMELLIQDWSLSAKLRLPAISRLQKVHNVDVALQVLKSKGLDLKDEHGAVIDSRDVVDGHREKTLSLLWKIIFAFHVEVILDEDQLREEIGFLKRTLSTKRRLVSLRADRGLQPSPAKTRQPQTEHSSTKINLLMDWARAVGDFYSLKVENFTVTFSDGRVLCYLIHHYHPGLLPEVAVSHSTTQTVECSPRGRLELSCSASDSDSSFDSLPTGLNGPDSPSVEFKELLENEKNNFRLVNNAVAFLGGVPAMINPADMSNTIPNEKVVMSYLTFLCARLLDLRNETRAARVIQGAWRKYRLKKDLQLYKAQWRMFSATRAYQRLTYYAIVVQAQWRMRRAAAAYGRTYWAATVLQKRSRASALARRDRQRYLSLRAAVVKLQRGYRRWKGRKSEKENHAATVIQAAFKTWYEGRRAERTSAAVRIQSWYRTRSCLRRYGEIKRSAILIQARYRGHAQRRSFEALKLRLRSAVVIQSAFRGHAVRKQVATARCAAVVIQRWFRATAKRDVQRRAFVRMRCAAVTVQAAYRGKVAREFLARRHKAASVIQAAFRRCAARRRYLALRRAAVVIQQKYRATVLARETTGDFQALRRSALVIQAHWQGRADRKRMETRHKCAALIQAHYRRHRAQAEYRSQKAAAEVIQRQFRAYVAGRETREAYLSTRAACVALQAGFRGMRVRKELEEKRQAATVIQSSVRMLLSRKRYVLLQSASIVIQSRYRALLLGRTQRTEYRVLRQAAVKIQAAYRACRVRADLRRRHSAARAIQAQFRMYRTRMAYLATKCAAIIIQERYRAKRLRDKEWRRYMSMKSAAVVIQAAYRGHVAKGEVAEMHRAATIIQRKFLAMRDRNRFVAMKAAAWVCQQRYRAVTLARRDRLDYLSKRRAAVGLQAAFRGFEVRRQWRIQRTAAVAIQSHFRKYRQRVYYTRLRWAANVLQARYRANKETRREMHTLRAKRNAAVVLQAAFRGMKCRRVVKQSHQAASVIQRAYRARCERRHYLTLKSLVVTVQRRYRATVAAKEQMQKYQQMQRAALVLQAAYRGQKVRREVTRRLRAATVIQSMFRKHREEVKFQAMRLSAVIIQRHYRSRVLQRQERERFLQLRQSAVVLQAAFRGHRVRSNIAEMHRAATVLQSHFKRHRQQSAFRRRRWAACVFQQRFRAQRQRDTEIKDYQEVRKAAIVLQAAYRGQKVRREVAHWHRAATVIQSMFRKHREEVKFQAMRLSAVIIQRHYRSLVLQKQERERFLQLRQSAVVLQAAFRGHRVRSDIAEMHRAATVLQSHFKRHRQQSAFRRRRWAACVFQQRFRAQRQRDTEIKDYQEVRKAAIVLQAAYRGMKSRRNVKQSHQAASVIQRSYRTHCERRNYLTLKSSVLTVQRRYRATVAAKEQMQNYQEMRRATVVLQAAYRGQKVRREVAHWHHAATVIQSMFRKHREEVKFQAMRLSAIIIQRHYRSRVLQRQERERFLQLRQSAVVLQAAFRGHRVRSDIAEMHRAATVLQSHFKRHRQQSAFRRRRWAACVFQQRFRAQRQRDTEIKHYQEVRKAAIVLQAAYRGMKSRRNVKQRHQAASVLQRVYRAHSERKQYLKLKLSVLAIQRKYRATVSAKVQRTQYLETRSAAIVLQAAYRGQKVRQEVARRHRAATVIQSVFRKHREEVRFQALRLSAVIIQRHYRAHLLQRRDGEEFLKKKRSAILLQAAFRGRCVRREIGRRNRTAVVIQSRWRGLVQRRVFQRKREAAVTLQRRIRAAQRGRAQRNDYVRTRRAAVALQTHCRAWIARRQVLEAAKAERRLRFTSAVFHHLSAMKIQRALRAHRALVSAKRQIHSVVTVQRWVRARQQRRRYLEDRRKVVVAQRAIKRWSARRHDAASVIQQAVRRFLLLRRQQRVEQGIVKAQALWRGHRSRRLNDKPKVVRLRHRLRQVSAAVREEDKLCNKTSSALDYLLRYKHFSYILEALKNLETATRLSPECCERLVGSGATNVIFTLIRCCNRSVPCMDVITFSIQILLNLSKYHKTIEAVYSVENSVETLLDLLQRYREKAGDKVAEKGGGIFTKACFLLALLLQDQHRAAVRWLLRHANSNKLTGLKRQWPCCERLPFLFQEVTKLPKTSDRIRSIYRLTARKHKMDAERTVTKQKMNAFAPDWVLRKDKLQDIVDPLRAIQMVADKLSIVL